mgnify:CR=1 FL=1
MRICSQRFRPEITILLREISDLRDEADELHGLLKSLDPADWQRPTLFKAWTVDDIMRHLLDRARDQFDVILIDTPPVSAVADPLVLAPLADGTLLVTSMRTTNRNALTRSIELLRATNSRLLGIVANRSRMDDSRYSYYQGYYHEADEKQGGMRKRTARQRAKSLV